MTWVYASVDGEWVCFISAQLTPIIFIFYAEKTT